MSNPNTLIIGDTHIPFVRRDYLEFCRHVAHEHKVRRVAHVGDIVDNHAISFHDSDPDGMSPGTELKAARKEVARWVRAFRNVDFTIGNHDALGSRKGFVAGLPKAWIRNINEVLDLPKSWRMGWEHRYGNWRLTHGTGSSGHDAAFKVSVSHRISTAQGHIHTAAGVKFHASPKDILWGLQVGCGIDRKSYAYAYGRDFKDKPILGCGVVLEGGTLPMFIPMPL